MQKELKFTISFILGIIASLITVFVYSSCVVLVYKLVIYRDSKDFILGVVSSIDIWLSILLLSSILYGFCVSTVYLMRNFSETKSKIILNLVFFFITVLIIIITISYMPSVRLFMSKATKSSLILVPIVLIIILSLHFFLSLKSNIFIIFKYILKIAKYDNSVYFKDPNRDKKIIYARMKKDRYDYFYNTIKNLIIFANNNKTNMGIMCFKIINYSDIISKYGDAVVKQIEPQILNSLRDIKQFSKHDYFIKDDLIYSFLYNDEKEVFALTDRYNKVFKSYKFTYNDESITITIAVSAGGFNFAKSHKFDVETMTLELLKRIKRATDEAENSLIPVVYYE